MGKHPGSATQYLTVYRTEGKNLPFEDLSAGVIFDPHGDVLQHGLLHLGQLLLPL
jgi:hypothetical protein